MTAKKANATYPMDTKRTLSPAMAERIATKFKENQTKFSRFDFVDLAKKYKKSTDAVTRILYYMEEKGKIVAVDELKPAGGGRPFKVYQVVSASAFADEEGLVSIEQHNKECGARLHEVLNKIVRRNAVRT